MISGCLRSRLSKVVMRERFFGYYAERLELQSNERFLRVFIQNKPLGTPFHKYTNATSSFQRGESQRARADQLSPGAGLNARGSARSPLDGFRASDPYGV